ncbi:hypothetical protein KTO58_16740 [Chitinophaga pendula]|uniref:hypothetical protein n=1 Tax=Chitinophaga TaxID=79328 RepID=UPI000BB05771|nr:MULTISPECIES: hypothetical protein [Chitinophaga]ASZ11649.1 hypothetical protein CK934_12105 [Chitinophaga sp. MD30]UCJ05338.1 hypothetical protein KTO58_16740 [Chitinophaga pendula]
MISLHDLKVGDTVIVDNEGTRMEGEVVEINHEDKQICVATGEQEFWYSLDKLYSIPLDEEQLLKLKFQKDTTADNGSATYIRGPFAVKLYYQGGQSMTLLSYRDEYRDIKGELTVNQLQNHYHGMTNFHLE